MKTINNIQFKSLILKIPSTTLEDVSILLPDDYFECKLSKKVSKEKLKTMFLGLNRSFPNLYRLDFDNMRHPVLELINSFKNKSIKKRLTGSYLSDFIKYPILKQFFKNGRYADSKDVYRIVRENPQILEKCGQALLKEMSAFQIETVFCFGWATYDLVHRYFANYTQFRPADLNSNEFSVKMDKKNVNIIRLTHYSKMVPRAGDRIEKEIRSVYFPTSTK